MRLCRYEDPNGNGPRLGFYSEERIVPLDSALLASGAGEAPLPHDSVLPYLAHGEHAALAEDAWNWLADHPDLPGPETGQAKLLLPHPRPPKLFLLAGNYAAHIEEGGGRAVEREKTFPYVFMKPPSTTLTPSGAPVKIPRVSPDHIDWELELGVLIGRGGKHIEESEALSHVAGYTVINDISDRQFRPNAEREERPNNRYFDWLHGKWHDSFCACGPCVVSAGTLPDAGFLPMRLSVNGEIKQDATTAQQIFPVEAVIAFISSFVTLEPGDLIATGTPAGVGQASGTFLKPGDHMEATIDGIGTLVSPVEAE